MTSLNTLASAITLERRKFYKVSSFARSMKCIMLRKHALVILCIEVDLEINLSDEEAHWICVEIRPKRDFFTCCGLPGVIYSCSKYRAFLVQRMGVPTIFLFPPLCYANYVPFRFNSLRGKADFDFDGKQRVAANANSSFRVPNGP
ncbi:hypothetical protein L596_026678 [Steinernema carpocapsae]|uniref:Uncharacterized protein n=1 Tax=Steinernema carpocapsae TaxID=34508 RepID=A0A4U5M247_STECR|nr:hypothetical protein L596_026678 [Steinernema carpocapsae]